MAVEGSQNDIIWCLTQTIALTWDYIPAKIQSQWVIRVLAPRTPRSEVVLGGVASDRSI